MARRSKLNTALIERMARLIGEGVPGETAAQACGIAPSTYYAYLKRGREARDKATKPAAADRLYIEFAEAIDTNLAISEATLLGIVKQAAPKTWQAAAWMLERRWPAKYGRVTRPEPDTKTDDKAAIVKALKVNADTDPLPGE